MKMSNSPLSSQNLDDQLADFTDRVLAEKTTALASDPELRQAEELILRLKQAYPEQVLEEKAVKRLQADFKTRLRKANSARPGWRSQQTRQRIGLALAAAAVLVALVIFAPFLFTSSGNVQGTAGLQPQSIGWLIGLGVVLALAIWLVRRK